MEQDLACGYDAAAEAFIAARSSTGSDVVRRWAEGLAAGGQVLDVGCGHGEPLTRILIERGLKVWAIDASPKLVAAFEARFKDSQVRCESVQTSDFFGRRFDAVVCVGLIFLLPQADQEHLIAAISKALKPGGCLLLSAPLETGSWQDTITDHTSLSLGQARYEALLQAAGFDIENCMQDDGGSNYYRARMAASPADWG